jgi:hypothetical protein
VHAICTGKRPHRTLLRLLGGAEDDDVLDALAAYYQQHGGQLSELMRCSEVAAEFDNWHS